MAETCKLSIDGKELTLPIIRGTEDERGIDIATLRKETGCVTYDDGFVNTGSCQSNITFIDGEKGILRYRGYPIEDLAAKASFAETSYLLIYGELPDRQQLSKWSGLLTKHEMLHEDMRYHYDGFPVTSHPMAILSAMINATLCFNPDVLQINLRPGNPESAELFMDAAARIISKVRTIAAFAYKKSVGHPRIYPKPEMDYTANFLHMMFSIPYREYELKPEVINAMRLMFILHADHEQNCSTSTVRMVASSGANLFASAAAGVCALWGPLHGGANQAVIEMLEDIQRRGEDIKSLVERAKDKNSGFRLMGFGHRVYKNYDPRARIIKKSCDEVLGALKINDPLLDLARRLEEVALSDPYFVERKLYPNVDFYSGIILRALGIPVTMYTVIFAIGRMPGWVAHFKEVQESPGWKIYRPRQIYQGATERHFLPIEQR
ncbi:MAG: citrate synthase [Candidatus Sumerlaeota bacterium]|nr:citrate synthase [Candidatus Sumerlaeota bacterium]